MSVARELASLVSASPVTSGANLEKRGPAGTGAASAGVLLLSTAELTVVDSDQLGRIDFQAPLETGTDAIVVAASIYAEADDTFAADNNSTELVFATGASEAAAEKMRLTHDGELGIGVATPASLLHVAGTVQVGVDDTGHDVKFFGATSGKYWEWDESADKVVAVSDLQQTGTVTVGVDDTGHDVKFFGASAGAFMLYDESEDTLEIRGPSADASTSTGKLLLSTALTDINDGDVLGRIDFKAPLEAGGTDAILIGASIYAEADDTFAADNNATELVFATGASEAAAEKVRITSDGRVGIGTAAPTGKFQVEGDQNYLLYVKQSSTNVNLAAFRGASSTGLDLQLDGTNDVVRFNSTGTGDAIRFDTNDGTGRMRINSDGEVGISPSDADPTSTLQVSYVAGTVALAAYRNGGTIGQFQAQDTSGTREMIKFIDGAGTTCGSIDINAGTNTTAFSTSSDYRLKQNIKSLTSGLEKIKKLKPIQFNWKKIAGRDDTITNTGFIAHEVQEIIPESAIGEKDAVKTVKNAVWNKNGNLVEEDITKEKFEQKMAKGDYDQYEGQEFEWKASKETMEIQKVSKEPMIPFIVGALQELSDKIDSLEKKIGS